MKKNIVVAIALLLPLLFPTNLWAQGDETDETFDLPPQVEDVFYRGVIVGEPAEQIQTEFGQTLIIQTATVKLQNGPEEGRELELDFQMAEGTVGRAKLDDGDRVIVGKAVFPDDTVYYISDVYRLHGLWILGGLFLLLVLLLARWAGIRSLIGLLVSFAVIIYYIVPRIIEGQNALMVGFVGTLVIATVSIFVAHGFRSRTTIAFVSTLITVMAALGIAVFFTDMMHLFGLGSEEAFLLQTSPEKIFNLRGILLAGIIIGTLGVLDDITTAQAAVVEELHLANESLSRHELYKRGSSVGREHIISLVNTLVLAYTGAALPLLLLFDLYDQPTWLVLNSEIIIEEVVRMLVGSIALILAVPLTTGLAAWYYTKKKGT